MASSRIQFLLLGTLGACTAYTPSDVSVTSVIAASTDHPGGAFSLDQANLLALQRNPAILAALAEQRAAAAIVQPLMLEAEYRSGTEMLALMLDPVALLGSGPRGGAQGVDAAKATAALVAVREAVWRVHGELLEAFAVDRALADARSELRRSGARVARMEFRLRGDELPTERGNTFVGRHLDIDSQGMIVHACDGHLVVTLGLEDMLVVHTPDATLVADRSREEEVRIIFPVVTGVISSASQLLPNFRPPVQFLEVQASIPSASLGMSVRASTRQHW
jgi:hypothetical protein